MSSFALTPSPSKRQMRASRAVAKLLMMPLDSRRTKCNRFGRPGYSRRCAGCWDFDLCFREHLNHVKQGRLL